MCVCARGTVYSARRSCALLGQLTSAAKPAMVLTDPIVCIDTPASFLLKSLIFDNKNKNKKQRLPAGSQVLCATLTPAHSRLSDLLSSCRGTAKFLKFAQTRAHTQRRLRRLSENALMCPLLKSQRESLRLSHASKFNCLRKDN